MRTSDPTNGGKQALFGLIIRSQFELLSWKISIVSTHIKTKDMIKTTKTHTPPELTKEWA